MTAREVTLEAAAFLESPQAHGLTTVPADARRTIIESFLECLFTDLGKAPRLLDGDDLHAILGHLLPKHFGQRDARAAHVLPVLRAWLEFLTTRAIVSQGYELRRALEADIRHFEEAVRTGTPHAHGHDHGQKGVPFVHKAEKTGRNDPCPCGSGRKFKQCCLKLAGG